MTYSTFLIPKYHILELRLHFQFWPLFALLCFRSLFTYPQNYSSLIRYNMSSTIDYTIPDFNSYFMYGQQPPLQQQQQQRVQSKAYFIEEAVGITAQNALRNSGSRSVDIIAVFGVGGHEESSYHSYLGKNESCSASFSFLRKY